MIASRLAAVAPPRGDMMGYHAQMSEATQRALFELQRHLKRDGRVPAEWLSAHAPDGDLERMWADCQVPLLLLQLGASGAEHRALVRCACALAREATRTIPAGTSPLPVGVDAAEAWCEGRATRADLEAAQRLDFESWHDDMNLPPAIAEIKRAVRMAIAAALTATRVASAGGVERAVQTRKLSSDVLEAARSTERVVAALVHGDPDWQDLPCAEALADVAEIVRAHVPCPTIEQLQRSFGPDARRDAG